MKKIVTFGPGPRFKGGIANYNTSLAKALDRREDVEVHIVSWTQQYPAIIPRDFIDRKSKTDQLAGTAIKVHYLLNYNRPSTWRKTVRFIRSLKPDAIIIQWAISVQGIPLRYVAKMLQKAGIRVLFDVHFVVQKENSNLDRIFTKRCLKFADTYITHALNTFDELKALLPERRYLLWQPGDAKIVSPDPEVASSEAKRGGGVPVLKLYHPVYDMFQKDDGFDVEAFKAGLGLKKHVFLFFGFIRKYKGLHNVIEAFNLVSQKRDDVSLLIVGELFWSTLDNKKLSTRIKSAVFGVAKRLFLSKEDDEKNYKPLDLIDRYNLHEKVATITEFVPNEDVHKYFQASDSITLFYMAATPSGVESMSYNFGLPILAARVGHFKETVKDGYNGYLAEPENPESMAEVMIQSIAEPIPAENVYATSAEMSWDNYATAIIEHGFQSMR
ncbi:MAG: glycosyltransferase [Bacteroidota bacterium]